MPKWSVSNKESNELNFRGLKWKFSGQHRSIYFGIARTCSMAENLKFIVSD